MLKKQFNSVRTKMSYKEERAISCCPMKKMQYVLKADNVCQNHQTVKAS